MIVRDRAQLLSALKHFEKDNGSAACCSGVPWRIRRGLLGSGKGRAGARVGLPQAYTRVSRDRRSLQLLQKTDAPQLLTAAARLVEAKSYSGVAMFEFKADAKGVCRLLEVNPRVWGTYPLTRVCGSNFTYMWYSAALDLPLPAFDGGREVKMVYYPSDFAAMLGYLKHGNIGAFLSGAADFFQSACQKRTEREGRQAALPRIS